MGSCYSTCQNHNQQIRTFSICEKEPIYEEGMKQPFKPPILLTFQKKLKPQNYVLPIKQYQGDFHPILQNDQKEIEDADFFNENYITTMNQCKKYDEFEQILNHSPLSFCQSNLSNSLELLSAYSNNSLPQKKKQKKRRHRSKDSNVKVQNQKAKGKKQDSLFFKNHKKEFPNRLQQLLAEHQRRNNFEESSSLKSILKKPSDRKVQSHSPIQKQVSFAKR